MLKSMSRAFAPFAYFFLVLLLACALPTQPSQGAPVAQGCLQTGFGHPGADVNTLAAVKGLGFAVSRIDVQALNADQIDQQQRDHMAVGLVPLAIVRDAEQLSQLGFGYYELRNEPDLEGPSPSEYHVLMHAAAAVARVRGQVLYVGAISNLNSRGFAYLHAIRPFPEGVRISVHRYGDGTFDDPHSGFANRESEVRWLKAAIGDRPFAVTEFGYPNEDMSEEEAARRIRVEFEFWAGKADFACLYQLNDGPRNFAIDKFGIRRLDGSWKPSAYVLR